MRGSSLSCEARDVIVNVCFLRVSLVITWVNIGDEGVSQLRTAEHIQSGDY